MNKNTKRNSEAKHKSARMGANFKGGAISCSPRKNVQMVVFINRPEVGPAQSITRFEPLNREKPAFKRVFPKVGVVR